MISAILNRRSIRKYKSDPVPKEIVEEIIQAGRLAPSSKNRQPWKFIVVSGEAKAGMLTAMQKGLYRESGEALLPGSKQFLSGAEYTLKVMRQAPVTIFIVNTLGINLFRSITAEERIYEICNAQSVGAAIENMSIAAAELRSCQHSVCDICRYARGGRSDCLWYGREIPLIICIKGTTHFKVRCPFYVFPASNLYQYKNYMYLNLRFIKDYNKKENCFGDYGYKLYILNAN